MTEDPNLHGQLTLDLDCSAYHVKGPAFAPACAGEQAGLFSCSVGPLPDDTLVALDRAASAHNPVRLLFNGNPLLLELVALERKDPQSVKIVGHVLMRA